MESVEVVGAYKSNTEENAVSGKLYFSDSQIVLFFREEKLLLCEFVFLWQKKGKTSIVFNLYRRQTIMPSQVSKSTTPSLWKRWKNLPEPVPTPTSNMWRPKYRASSYWYLR